ncbi:hypothetical protein DRO61_09515 [Candidatus Bathyarchaeota archaeon]|nr:MAG: hypothetical protein DRO61_09515 [Candidatus Bathyarchaeota archaeon]
MGFIYKDRNIKEKRVKLIIDKLYKALTNLAFMENEAALLIDKNAEEAYIAERAINEGDTSPLLPLGDELVLNWNEIVFNYESESKFIVPEYNDETNQWDDTFNSVLELETGSSEESDGESIYLESGVKIKQGLIILENLERYDYDYTNYGLLNEILIAMRLYLDSVEAFYSQFYTETLESTGEPYNDYDDSAVDSRTFLIYDTRDMDTELVEVINPITEQIDDEVARDEVQLKYGELRDRIKFYCMGGSTPAEQTLPQSLVFRIERDIDELLYCINGTRKYYISYNNEVQKLELLEDEGVIRTIHREEKIFFPYHNKYIIDSFTEGLISTF